MKEAISLLAALVFIIISLTACNKTAQPDVIRETPPAEPNNMFSDETDETGGEPDNTSDALPDSFESEVLDFLRHHFDYDSITRDDELKPYVSPIYAIQKAYEMETALGNSFDTFGSDSAYYGFFKIPVETVNNVIPRLYSTDGHSAGLFDDYIADDSKEHYFLPEGFSGNYMLYSIKTANGSDGIYEAKVAYLEDSPGTPKLAEFIFKFEQVLYKDELVCYRFIGAYNCTGFY